MMCSQTAAIHIDGPVGYARTYPAAGAWNYAVYGAPVLQPQPTYVVSVRRA
jgi:hypothetical protein